MFKQPWARAVACPLSVHFFATIKILAVAPAGILLQILSREFHVRADFFTACFIANFLSIGTRWLLNYMTGGRFKCK